MFSHREFSFWPKPSHLAFAQISSAAWNNTYYWLYESFFAAQLFQSEWLTLLKHYKKCRVQPGYLVLLSAWYIKQSACELCRYTRKSGGVKNWWYYFDDWSSHQKRVSNIALFPHDMVIMLDINTMLACLNDCIIIYLLSWHDRRCTCTQFMCCKIYSVGPWRSIILCIVLICVVSSLMLWKQLLSFWAGNISYKRGNCVSMTSMFLAPTFSLLSVNRSSSGCRKPDCTPRQYHAITMRIEKPLEELYNVRVERQVSPKRLEELGVSRWSIWKTGKSRLPWDWHVDQLVYIEEGEVRVVPDGSKKYMQFVAGDLVRYPKWFEADLFFNGPYQERYRFRAYGDD